MRFAELSVFATARPPGTKARYVCVSTSSTNIACTSSVCTAASLAGSIVPERPTEIPPAGGASSTVGTSFSTANSVKWSTSPDSVTEPSAFTVTVVVT